MGKFFEIKLLIYTTKPNKKTYTPYCVLVKKIIITNEKY
jgi:hypothetical protein